MLLFFNLLAYCVYNEIKENGATINKKFFITDIHGIRFSGRLSCAKKLFNEISTSQVRYHDVDSYQSLLNIMKSIR